MSKVLILVIGAFAAQSYATTQKQYWDSFGVQTGECKTGKTQSPIDIPGSGNVEGSPFEGFTFKGYDKDLKSPSMSNTGTTAKMYSKDDPKPSMNGGNLGSEYSFAQLHFHWGSDKDQGSEHTFAGKKYPMELHLVHFNSSLGKDLTAAITKGNGSASTLAVLGIMYKIQTDDNPTLKPIIDGLGKIKSIKAKTDLTAFPLEKLLPSNINSFYRYQGGLTTPGCNQIVRWTVFKDPVGISEAQLAKFRTLDFKFNSTSATMRLENNYRLPTPLGDRKVTEYNSATAITVNILTVVGVIMTKVILF